MQRERSSYQPTPISLERLAVSTLVGWVVVSALAGSARAVDGPNLVMDGDRMASTMKITTGIYHPPKPGPPLDATIPVSGSCVLDKTENCVGGAGIRKLLRFDVLVHNEGNEDLVIGDPANLPNLFVYSPCHHHYHFKGAALYELLDATATKQVVKGRKQGFCIEDTLPDPNTHTPNKYLCNSQGIQVGWADWYPSVLDCQWIDITDIAPGDYTLHVFWNPQHLIPETTLDDNQAFAKVTIPADTSPAPVVDSIQVGQPRQTIVANTHVTVSWHAEAPGGGVVTQEVWFSKDDGATWTELVGDVPGTESSYTWAIPRDAATLAGRIRVVARDSNAQAGRLVSDAFRVGLPKLSLPKVRERG